MDPSQRVDARTAIENLLYRYAERIDAGDFAGVGELFSRGRILDPAGRVIGTGAAEVEAIYVRSTRRYADGTPGTQHLTTNVILEFADDGRSARARSRFTVMQALEDFPLQCIITGHYEDRFARDDGGGWHFVERQMKPTLVGDLSRHLNHRLAEGPENGPSTDSPDDVSGDRPLG